MSLASLSERKLSGYAADDEFIATRKRMGGRWVIHIDMAIAQLVLGVDAPPVGTPQEDNREVSQSRGTAFAMYVKENKRWACPSLLLWCPEEILRFEPIPEIMDALGNAQVEIGILHIPRNSRLSIRILDGQHRVLGFHVWVEKLNEERLKAADHLARARDGGDSTIIQDAKKRLELADAALNRANIEAIGIDLVECNAAKEARQIFADIANNAKGMTKALTTGFDTSKIANRVTQYLAIEKPHPLLDGRVEWNKDRLGGANSNLLTAKTVADIVRAVSVGVVGRFSRQQERTLEDSAAAAQAGAFFDALQAAFPILTSIPAPEVRETSLLGSSTTLRVLAGAWHLLTKAIDDTGRPVSPRMTQEQVTIFFSRLAHHMDAPVRAGNPWLGTGAFPALSDADAAAGVGFMAPSSRNQDLRGLAETLHLWATEPSQMPF